MSSRHVVRLLRVAFSVAIGVMASRAAADTPVSRAPLELTAGKLLAWSLGQDHSGTVVGALVNLVPRD